MTLPERQNLPAYASLLCVSHLDDGPFGLVIIYAANGL